MGTSLSVTCAAKFMIWLIIDEFREHIILCKRYMGDILLMALPLSYAVVVQGSGRIRERRPTPSARQNWTSIRRWSNMMRTSRQQRTSRLYSTSISVAVYSFSTSIFRYHALARMCIVRALGLPLSRRRLGLAGARLPWRETPWRRLEAAPYSPSHGLTHTYA